MLLRGLYLLPELREPDHGGLYLIGLAAGHYVEFPVLTKMVADALVVGLLFGVIAPES
jgi:hypothetical protein